MMDSCQELLSKAKKSLKVAEQMLIKTYPVVEEPKLILAVAGDVYAALLSSIDAVLIHEKGKLPESEGVEPKLELFSSFSMNYGFDDKDLFLIKRIHEIIERHKESPVEFPRKDQFVICDEHYHCDILSLQNMKNYLFRANLFVEKAENTVLKSKEKE